MFVVLLKFSNNQAQADALMDGRIARIKRGFYDGVFLLFGSIQLGLGGAVIAQNTSLSDLQGRVSIDPFVAEDVVTSEILEITPGQTDERFAFLLDSQ
jgi:uncharacterized protein YciI